MLGNINERQQTTEHIEYQAVKHDFSQIFQVHQFIWKNKFCLYEPTKHYLILYGIEWHLVHTTVTQK